MTKPISHKSHNNRLRFYSMMIFFLIVAIIGTSFYLYKEQQKTSTRLPEKIEIPIHSQPKPKVKWWDMNWRTALNLNITNDTYQDMDSSNYASFDFDHKSLIDNKMANADGSDLRIIYQNQNNDFSILNFSIENISTDNSIISFNLAETLSKRVISQSYFLYYGKKS